MSYNFFQQNDPKMLINNTHLLKYHRYYSYTPTVENQFKHFAGKPNLYIEKKKKGHSRGTDREKYRGENEREQKDSVFVFFLFSPEHRRQKFIARRAWEVIKKKGAKTLYTIYIRTRKWPRGFNEFTIHTPLAFIFILFRLYPHRRYGCK